MCHLSSVGGIGLGKQRPELVDQEPGERVLWLRGRCQPGDDAGPVERRLGGIEADSVLDLWAVEQALQHDHRLDRQPAAELYPDGPVDGRPDMRLLKQLAPDLGCGP